MPGKCKGRHFDWSCAGFRKFLQPVLKGFANHSAWYGSCNGCRFQGAVQIRSEKAVCQYKVLFCRQFFCTLWSAHCWSFLAYKVVQSLLINPAIHGSECLPTIRFGPLPSVQLYKQGFPWKGLPYCFQSNSACLLSAGRLPEPAVLILFVCVNFGCVHPK